MEYTTNLHWWIWTWFFRFVRQEFHGHHPAPQGLSLATTVPVAPGSTNPKSSISWVSSCEAHFTSTFCLQSFRQFVLLFGMNLATSILWHLVLPFPILQTTTNSPQAHRFPSRHVAQILCPAQICFLYQQAMPLQSHQGLARILKECRVANSWYIQSS